ncbi:hypothetical protein ACWGR4_01640 [Embleya sp. NPDC055664]
MRMTVLCSLTGAPGVTTTALALATAWPTIASEGRERSALDVDRVLVEADPSGGDIAAWLGLSDTPGLIDLAAATRRSFAMGDLLAAAGQTLTGQCHGVLAPASAAQTGAALAFLEQGRFAVLRRLGAQRTLFVDVGRLSAASRSLAEQADVVLLLSRGGVDALSHVAAEVEDFAKTRTLCLVVVGACAYSPDEIRKTLGIDWVGRLPWDPLAATDIQIGRGGIRRFRRSRLPAAIEVLGADMLRRVESLHSPDAHIRASGRADTE